MRKFPVYKPSLEGNEKKYVNDCLDSSWISSKGNYVKLFEEKFASYLGVKYATGVCNGTVALHLTMEALGVGPGDEVIVPTLTYISPVNSVTYTGATPIFVDSLFDTWQLDPEQVESKINDRTKAIIAVHLYGQPCDMDRLKELGEKYNLFLIEDAAEAFGSEYKNQKCGSLGDVSIFSFYGNKTITTGEGGMVTTNDETLFERIVHLKGQGLAKYREYWHDTVGYNYRMTNICGAIGLAQLEQAESILKKKRNIAENYIENLKSLQNITWHKETGNVYHSYWMFSILLDNAKYREDFRRFLTEKGIETRPIFYPVHTMPMYSKKIKKMPVAENLGWRGVNLPSYPSLTKEDIQFISNCIIKYFNESL